MTSKKNETKTLAETSSDQDVHLQEVNKEIYKHSLELAQVNKTLSLLRKLYQISLLSLDSTSLAQKVSEAIRIDLNMELVIVFTFDSNDDSLLPLEISKSDRLTSVTNKLGFPKSKIEKVFRNNHLKKVVYDKTPVIATDLNGVWHVTPKDYKLNEIATESHIKTIMLYPLIAQEKVIGVLLFGINRELSSLSHYEKDSIENLNDVVAVALDKALLYEQLQHANEQLKILDQARSEFITIASHQLRTPPATIKWYLAAIIGGDFGALPKEAAEQLRKAQWTNESLIALIDDLLNVSRIERGKLEFIFEPVDLLGITKVTVDQLRPQAEIKKLRLTFNEPQVELPKITADKEKLRQVINNFIDNAIKYTKEGEITVELSQQHDSVTLRVTDTGKGVKPEQRESIFEKFDRGKDAVQHATGLGLGLYVAKVIIAQHNGKIWVESEGEGKGSTFAFSLPIHTELKESVFDLTKTQKLDS